MRITLLPPSARSVLVAGLELDVVREAHLVRRAIGYVPQLLSADGPFTAHEKLLLSARLYHLQRGEREAQIADALGFMGLADAGDRLVSEYCGGMIFPLELAQAMLHHPTVLFLDEPTVGLDPAARATVWQDVPELREGEGTTILLTKDCMERGRRAVRPGRGDAPRSGRGALCKPSELKAEVGPTATLDDAVPTSSMVSRVGDALGRTPGS